MVKSFTKILLIVLSFLVSTQQTYSQINMADSSAQIVGYWSIGETQSFDVSFGKLKITEDDTVSRLMINYEIDVTILDSTENSYTIEWFYKNYKIDTDSELVKKMTKATEDVSVIIKTNEFGTIQEVLNWEEIRDFIGNAMKQVENEAKDIPGIDKIIEQSLALYNSKEAIEANAIKDAVQFYNFHGVAYNLNEELSGQMQFTNNYGGNPFDVDVTIFLDELNEENDNSVIRMMQVVNQEQLRKATYEYLINIGTFGNEIPDLDSFPEVTNEIWTASRIHGSTGWTTYSIETKEVKSAGSINVEERIIQIK